MGKHLIILLKKPSILIIKKKQLKGKKTGNLGLWRAVAAVPNLMLRAVVPLAIAV